MTNVFAKESKNAYFAVGQVLFQYEVEAKGDLSMPQDVLAQFSADFAGEQLTVRLNPAGVDRVRALAQLSLKDATTVAEFVIEMSKMIGSEGLTITAEDGRIFRFTGVSPNWLTGGAPQTIGTGGPGSLPARTPALSAREGRFAFPQLALRLGGRRIRRRPVDVFILDTIPGQGSASGKRTDRAHTLDRLDARDRARFGEHPLGRLWLEATRPGPLPNSVVTVSPRGDMLTRVWADPGQLAALRDERGDPIEIAGHNYDMSDHGLFIAGIVKRIAPRARIHLIQALNEYGVGSTTVIADGFRKIQELRRRLKIEDAPYIVNCSFTFAVPVLHDAVTQTLKRSLVPHDTTDLPENMLPLLERPDWPGVRDLFESILSLARRDKEMCAIVAAAGNDSERGAIRAARYPARLGLALGVGALGTDGNRADFSNFPDSPISDGLMALGDARSLFTGNTPPGSSAPGTGYADWAGTSFATPVIAGALAMLMSKYGMSVSEAIQTLRDAEGGIEGATGGEIVTATQT